MQMLLDVGCDEVTGMDFSAGMVKQASENLRLHNDQQSIHFIEGDVFQSDWGGPYDLAVSFGAFGHVLPKQEAEFVARIANALSPGGQFVFVTTPMLPWWSAGYWMSRGFNAAMHVRNLLVRPKFIMYYLTFLWPKIQEHFQAVGMTVTAEPLFPNQRAYRYLLYVSATRNIDSEQKNN